MTEHVHNNDAFVQALQTAYSEARIHSPQRISETQERLRVKLEEYGITLTPDIMHALAFAVVEGRDL